MIVDYDGNYFNVKDTLECGQIFRFTPYKDGYMVFSADKACYAYNMGNRAYIECEKSDGDYFFRYFDLERDYKSIFDSACKQGGVLSVSAKLGKGVRILNQNSEEMIFSFIVSQNNNIPRIKGIINRLCTSLGEKKTFSGESYYAFPSAKKMSEQNEEFFKGIGLGYRAPYIYNLALSVKDGLKLDEFNALSTVELKKKLLSIYGVGPKVADCVSLFGYHRSNSFPVDTWIEKVYREDFNGTLTDRSKIAEWFTDKFGDNSGYFQQYLFYYKRSLDKPNK